MREVGSIKEYDGIKYELLEDNIVPEKRKKKFILALNLYTLLLLIPVIILTSILIPGGITISIGDGSMEVNYWDYVILFGSLFGIMLSFIVYIIVHEWLHGLAFKVFNKNNKNQLKFGIVWKSSMAYCISTIPVKVDAARLSLMMPVYVVCLPMYIIGVITQNYIIALLAGLFFTGSTGDIYYMWKLRKTSKDHYMYESMPSPSGYEVGYLLYKKLGSVE